jgi:hypothetical protein
MNKKNQFSQIKNEPSKARRKGLHAEPPWADLFPLRGCHLDSHYDVLAESLIQPKEGPRDPFWDQASRTILKTALKKYAAQGVHDIEKFYTFLKSASAQEFEGFFEGTEAAPYTSSSSRTITPAIRTLLASQIKDFLQTCPPLFPAVARAGAGSRAIDPGIPLFASSDEENPSDATPLYTSEK